VQAVLVSAFYLRLPWLFEEDHAPCDAISVVVSNHTDCIRSIFSTTFAELNKASGEASDSLQERRWVL
jgi:hypothetical protein